MSDITKVTGQECLNYINKDLGFGSYFDWHNTRLSDESWYKYSLANYIRWDNSYLRTFLGTEMDIYTNLLKMSHPNVSRIVGYVSRKYDDGGLEVSILGSGTIDPGAVKQYMTRILIQAGGKYELESPISDQYVLDGVLPQYPEYGEISAQLIKTDIRAYLSEFLDSGVNNVSFDNAIEYAPTLADMNKPYNRLWRFNGIDGQEADIPYQFVLGTNPDSMKFGAGIDYYSTFISPMLKGNPLAVLSGNLYEFMREQGFISTTFIPAGFPDDLALIHAYVGTDSYVCESWNRCAIPFNLLLTDNIDYAKAYISTGTLPPDAYLYPLDWENLPTYQQPDDDGDDGEDDNKPDDNTRNVTPNPPVVPSFTPSMLTNNNYYWLTAPQLEGFISWYWNDVGNITDIDDLLAKIEGLYNNLSQAILNIRFMPVEVSWIGGTGAQSNIKIAQIEKDGLVDTLSKTGKPSVETIGHIHIPNKYNSFVDLSPYSQLSVYLPYHGFLDLDMNIFTGHELYVKAIYDYMSGTIQYLLYYDNQFLVNTIICKMAMDIPISLQTKNDRDSAVFQNVSNVVGGLMGAGLSLGTGNPMGLLVGANALNSGVASAPLNVKGNVGEQGAFYAPPQCSIILRRPTISKPSADIWKSKVGQICGKSYTLANLTGYTTVYNPQITFSGNKNADNVTMKPLQSEIEEIYSALEKGVIL